jgi:hypothetical protein
MHSVIRDWSVSTASVTCKLKEGFMARTFIEEDVAERWPQACLDLLKIFRKFLNPHIQRKMQIVTPRNLITRQEEVNVLRLLIATHYDEVLGIFDTAIAQLETGEASTINATGPENAVAQAVKPPPSPPAAPSGARTNLGVTDTPSRPTLNPKMSQNSLRTLQNSLKRGSEDYPDDLLEAKRGPGVNSDQPPELHRSLFLHGPSGLSQSIDFDWEMD